jgi:hypothetical protein
MFRPTRANVHLKELDVLDDDLHEWETLALEGDFSQLPQPFLWQESGPFAHFLEDYKEAGGFSELSRLALAKADEARATVVWRGSAWELWRAGSTRVKDRQPVTLGVRPEHLVIGELADARIEGTLRIAEYLGSETMFYLTLADGSDLSVKADGLMRAKNGEFLEIGIKAAACHLFDAAGAALINGDLTK